MNKIIQSYAFGFANLERRLEVSNTTTYNAYSVTKTFAALAILQLAQQRCRWRRWLLL